MNSKVDEFLDRATKWQPEMKKLREIALSCGLTEEIKWGKPCYTSEGKNIVVIQGFKAYSALLFIKGYLVSDPKHILVKTGENTVVGRQARFTDVKEIVKVEAALKACIKDAIKVEKTSLGSKAIDRIGSRNPKSPKTKHTQSKT
jgi:uncharacterized protein YdeI (YjbR/CyaY-like superfamily)